MNRLTEWFQTGVSMLTKAGTVALEQAKNFVVAIFWFLVILAAIGFSGLVLRLQILVVLPVVLIAVITVILFAALRYISQYFKSLENLARVVGTFALWLFFFGFLTSVHPEWFYLGSDYLQALLVFGLSFLFISFFMIYIGSQSLISSRFMAGCVVVMTLFYGLQLIRPGFYDRLFSTRPNQAVTKAVVLQETVVYELERDQLVANGEIRLTTSDEIAILDTLPREFGGEQFINCMLANEYGDFVGGQKVWLPKRKIVVGEKEPKAESLTCGLINPMISESEITDETSASVAQPDSFWRMLPDGSWTVVGLKPGQSTSKNFVLPPGVKLLVKIPDGHHHYWIDQKDSPIWFLIKDRSDPVMVKNHEVARVPEISGEFTIMIYPDTQTASFDVIMTRT